MTDFDGFFNGKLAVVELMAVTDCEILILSREHYLILEAKYKETDKLKDQCLFLENAIEADRADMLTKKVWDRFLHFAVKYKFALRHLPNRLCASFINIHESDFCKLKAKYFKNAEPVFGKVFWGLKVKSIAGDTLALVCYCSCTALLLLKQYKSSSKAAGQQLLMKMIS